MGPPKKIWTNNYPGLPGSQIYSDSLQPPEIKIIRTRTFPFSIFSLAFPNYFKIYHLLFSSNKFAWETPHQVKHTTPHQFSRVCFPPTGIDRPAPPNPVHTFHKLRRSIAFIPQQDARGPLRSVIRTFGYVFIVHKEPPCFVPDIADDLIVWRNHKQ